MTTPASGPAGRPVILLVEDHDDSRHMYAEFLGDVFDVLQAADGEAAWQVLQTRRVDVLVTDLALPRLDGYQLIERIRADSRFDGLPVVALSGYSTPEQRAAGAGPSPWDVVFQKPCMPEDLLEAVARLASSRKNRG